MCCCYHVAATSCIYNFFLQPRPYSRVGFERFTALDYDQLNFFYAM